MMMMTQGLRYVGTYDIWWIETVGGQLWPLHNMDSYIISLYYALLGYQRRQNTNKCRGGHIEFYKRFLTTVWSFLLPPDGALPSLVLSVGAELG